MSHQKIIQDLIAWIDEHIDQPLNINKTIFFPQVNYECLPNSMAANSLDRPN